MPARPKAVAFDIIGTVFSLDKFRARLVALGLAPLALEFVYTAALRDSFALAATNGYAPFKTLMAAALEEIAVVQGVTLTRDQMDEALSAMAALDPHDDAKNAFTHLADAGFRMFALSNGAVSATAGLLERAGLDKLVERVFSVESVELSKPRAEVYGHAASEIGVSPDALALVACHGWDVHGAKAAGLIGCYVARGIPYPKSFLAPDVAGETLADVARVLVAR